MDLNVSPTCCVQTLKTETEQSGRVWRLFVSGIVLAWLSFVLGCGASQSLPTAPQQALVPASPPAGEPSAPPVVSVPSTPEEIMLKGLGSKSLLRIAAASDLQPVLPAIAEAFKRQQPDVAVTPTYGSSGNLYAQLTQEAPFDVFLSADESYPQKLIEAGAAEASTSFLYAEGALVLWVSSASGLNVETNAEQVLIDPNMHRLAIANPKHAPYGRAALAALTTWGFHQELESKLVYAENIAQAAQFAATGNVDAALLSHSLTQNSVLNERGVFWTVPRSAHPPLVQAGVIMASSKQKDLARQFTEFLTAGEGRTILLTRGFRSPQ